jgi:ubiquinone/menaquinone biosynthesis C-methylase UbiE
MENLPQPSGIDPRQVWNQAAVRFDEEPDHGLRDPAVRQAWLELLRVNLPPPPVAVLDIGCGTGSLCLALAELGHQVSGIDFSPAMIAQARVKAAAAPAPIRLRVMDAAAPRLARGRYDAIVCRHVLWALPEIGQVLRRWAGLLRPGGRLLLIEGFWHTGTGLHPQEVVSALPEKLALRTVQDLSGQPALWGGAVMDERYLISAERLTAKYI